MRVLLHGRARCRWDGRYLDGGAFLEIKWVVAIRTSIRLKFTFIQVVATVRTDDLYLVGRLY